MVDELTILAQDPSAWVALIALIAIELVLGIDNLIFISIVSNRLPEHRRAMARRIGIGLALVMRLALLGALAWVIHLTEPVFALFDQTFSWKDVILILGGVFLVWKATTEIHYQVDPESSDAAAVGPATTSLGVVILQIVALDAVFSIDSVITAVGLTPHLPIIVIAIVVSVIGMLVAARPLAAFIEANPTVVMLALGFLLMIGVMLIAEGFGVEVPKGYIYAAMAFSALVEGLNMLARRRRRRRRHAAARLEGAAPGEAP